MGNSDGETAPLRFVRLHEAARAPRYTRTGDAGLDLCSCESWSLAPGSHHLFCTGIAVEIPTGCVGLVWDRSGLATLGITSFGGVIDSGYRGELKVVLHNASDVVYHVGAGERIAQLLVQRVEPVEPVEVDRLSSSERGQAGFGSSGR